jgi:hypothetical protein
MVVGFKARSMAKVAIDLKVGMCMKAAGCKANARVRVCMSGLIKSGT